MPLVDVHAHLSHTLFRNDLNKVIERAKKAGLKAVVCSGINHPTNEESLELAKKYKLIKVSLGLYPIDLLGLGLDGVGLTRQSGQINLEEELKFIKKHKEEIVGIGECGLDFHWDKKFHEKQKENFWKIIDFAKKLNKPLIVHSRRAEAEVFEMLEASSLEKKRIILHCFEGRKHLLKKAIERGYNFTIPCTIVKLQHFQTLTELAPLSQLFTETDAPWLSPFSGQRNEPAFVAEAVKKIAEIKKLKVEEAAGEIWKNYEKVFGKS